MGKLKNGALSGKLGNMVGYMLNGQNIVRRRPETHKKSKASQLAAKEFGQAVKISRTLRETLLCLQEIKDPANRYAVDNAIRHWIRISKPGAKHMYGPFHFINKLEFNKKSSLNDLMKAKIDVDWSDKENIIINIPEIIPTRDVFAPVGTDTIEWTIEIASMSMIEQRSHDWYNWNQYSTPYDDQPLEAKIIELPYKGAPGQLGFAIVGLKFFRYNQLIRDVKWLPAGVVGSHYEEVGQ